MEPAEISARSRLHSRALCGKAAAIRRARSTNALVANGDSRLTSAMCSEPASQSSRSRKGETARRARQQESDKAWAWRPPCLRRCWAICGSMESGAPRRKYRVAGQSIASRYRRRAFAPAAKWSGAAAADSESASQSGPFEETRRLSFTVKVGHTIHGPIAAFAGARSATTPIFDGSGALTTAWPPALISGV
jgi:hypothetical protein